LLRKTDKLGSTESGGLSSEIKDEDNPYETKMVIKKIAAESKQDFDEDQLSSQRPLRKNVSQEKITERSSERGIDKKHLNKSQFSRAAGVNYSLAKTTKSIYKRVSHRKSPSKASNSSGRPILTDHSSVSPITSLPSFVYSFYKVARLLEDSSKHPKVLCKPVHN